MQRESCRRWYRHPPADSCHNADDQVQLPFAAQMAHLIHHWNRLVRRRGEDETMRKLIAALLIATTLAPVAAVAQKTSVRGSVDARTARRGEWRGGQENRVRSATAPDRVQTRGERGGYRNVDETSIRRGGDRPAFRANQPRLNGEALVQRPDRDAREGSFRMDQRYPRRAEIGNDQRQSGRAGYDSRPNWQVRRDDQRIETRTGQRERIQSGGDRRNDVQRRNYNGYGNRAYWSNRTDWVDNAYYRQRFYDRRNWNSGWRSESRYDWVRYRGVNRSAYSLPHYYAPYGWNGYRRFSIGVSLSSALWGRDYWIADPWSYRLPDAYDPYG